LAFAFVLLAACSGEPDPSGSSGVDQTKPFLQPDGPLRGFIMATGIADDGSIGDPRFEFTTDDREATALLGLGDNVPEDSTLTVAWYRFDGPGEREHLFSHQIRIGPGGYAFSQGIAAGGLAPDLYETVATMGEWQVRTPWVVRTPEPATEEPADTAGGGGSGPLGFVLQASAGDPAPPTGGESGWEDDAPRASPAPGDLEYDGPPPPAEPPPDSCTVDELQSAVDPSLGVPVEASVHWRGPCSTMILTATISGPPKTLASTDFGDTTRDESSLSGGEWTCLLPGRSDMPGTVVRFAAEGSEGAAVTEKLTLPDVGDTLTAAVESEPEAGSRVEPGSTVTLEALAMLFLPALGVEGLELSANGELFDSAGNASHTDEPIPCDLGRMVSWIRESKYEVPEDADPIIEICAEATGFDGMEARDCIELYTGEVWEGTYEGDIHYPTCNPAATFEGRLTLVVGADGAVAIRGSDGTVVHTLSSCVGGVGDTTETGHSSMLTAEKIASGFHIEGGIAGAGVLPQGLVVRVEGERGEGSTRFSMGITDTRVDVAIECTSCDGG
jgi:hypothetical protein